jgi:hypothetical protein
LSSCSFSEFDSLYRALTGRDGACRWQHRHFSDPEAGRFPTDIELAAGPLTSAVLDDFAMT